MARWLLPPTPCHSERRAAPPCHSERSEESKDALTQATLDLVLSPLWILRCAQNDRGQKRGAHRLRGFLVLYDTSYTTTWGMRSHIG